MKKPLALLLFSFLLSIAGNSQVTFSQEDNMAGLDDVFTPLNAGFVDLNGDFKDDLIRVENGNMISVDFQSENGKPFFRQGIATTGGSTQWTLCVGDINNDGFNDIMASGAYDGAKMYARLLIDPDYDQIFLSSSNFFAQGSNFADINNDGWLDMFICDDDGLSEIWINNKSGSLISDNTFIDMTTNPASDNSGNYGSEWVDFDSDGDLDLYIAKCRQGVQDPTDPRRINALFRNDGNNVYTEVAAEYGLAVGDQSWTVNFGDIDNDGDMDCLLANHNTIHGLYENIENDTFINISVAAGIDLEGFALQGFLRDLDNDGFLDVIISGGNDHVFMNNGDKTFTKNEDPFGPWDTHSLALGDANSDGFLDAYVNYGTGIVETGSRSDALWINSGNDNSFLKISLNGDSSNYAAIGARLELYGEWGIQIRDVRAGEGYGIVNSFSMNFGMGTANKADSLIIKWPSGLIDKYFDIEANQLLLAVEGKCMNPFGTINPIGSTYLCEGESVMLEAPAGESYRWSTGHSTQTISVSEQGIYHVTVYDDNGCFSISNPVGVNFEPDETPVITLTGEETPCLGTSVILTSTDANSFLWSNGAMDQIIEVSEDGVYSVTIAGECKDWTSNEIAISFLDAEEPIVTNDTIFEIGQTATLLAEGVNVSWFDVSEGGDPIATGNTFETEALEATTDYFVENEDLFVSVPEYVGLTAHQGGSLYSGDQFNGGLFFNLFEELTISSVLVNTDTPGQRIIEIFQEDEQLVYQDTFMIEEGENRLELNAHLFPGNNYRITTNQEFNNEMFGFNAPRLTRDENNVDYPYEIEDKISIINSVFGFGYYYYFYDWEVVGEDEVCLSDRITVSAVVDVESSIIELNPDSGLEIYPNPFSEELNIKILDSNVEAEILIYSLTGNKVLQTNVKGANEKVNVSAFKSGSYFMVIEVEGKLYHKKLIKI